MGQIEQPVRRIAVVGGGIAGLGAAWSLSHHYDVTLFDANLRPGGHANTIDVDDDECPLPVDTGFIVYNEPNYPNLVALFRHLGVSTVASDMSFAVSLGNGAFEYAGSNLNGLLAQRKNLASPAFWRMIADIRRFYEAAPEYLAVYQPHQTIGELLEAENYSRLFIDAHLVPMAAAIWSASRADIVRYPVVAFLEFFRNHGLLQFKDRPQWRSVAGGSREYVRRLLEESAIQLLSDNPVQSVIRESTGATVVTRDGESRRFDSVVLATHADRALELINRPSAAERSVLGAFKYSRNTAYLHEDLSLMPRRRAAWASWNYVQTDSDHADAPLCVSYWMNRLQKLDTARELFVTLNPVHQPQAALTHNVQHYEHPVFTPWTAIQQQRSIEIQGKQRVWFCGSYLGHGFHEDALQSGLWVAEQLGCERPWGRRGSFDRLPSTYQQFGHPVQAAVSA